MFEPTTRLKVFYKLHVFNASQMPYLNEISRTLKNRDALISTETDVFDLSEAFELVEDIDQADIALLPLKWNYYEKYRNTDLAEIAYSYAKTAGKTLIAMNDGDYPCHVPFTNVVIFERSGYRSRRGDKGQRVHAFPAFITDALKIYQNGQFESREKGSKPIVGFCGQAGGSEFEFLRREIINNGRKLAYRTGISPWEPAPFEHTKLRARVLQLLSSNTGVDSRFIIRNRYRGGYTAAQKDPQHQTKLDFIGNILNSDYTVCIRGNGNFSARFYETLCLGRIPIFIDTDCILPFDHVIDYRKYTIWIEQHEIPFMVEKIIDFHNSITDKDYKELQWNCRELWLDFHSRIGFYHHFRDHFPDLLYAR